MAAREPNHKFAGEVVTKCPRPDCPKPTLYVARTGSKYHCIGCWRKFGSGGRFRAAQQVPPSKRWLRVYSPERVNGPPPALVHVRLTVRLRLRPAKSGPATTPPASIAMENENWLPVTDSSTSELDDDVISTAGYAGATGAATAVIASGGDSLDAARPSWRSSHISTPDLLDIDFPDFDLPDLNFPHVDYSVHSNIARDEDCESTCSTPKWPNEHTAFGPSTLRALNLTHFGRKFAVCCGGSTVLP